MSARGKRKQSASSMRDRIKKRKSKAKSSNSSSSSSGMLILGKQVGSGAYGSVVNSIYYRPDVPESRITNYVGEIGRAHV